MRKLIRAFVLGLIEFRHDITTGFKTMDEYEAYDKGRELAHKLTLRYYETGF